MNFFSKILVGLVLLFSFFGFSYTHASVLSDIFEDTRPKVNICDGEECNIKTGIEQVKNTINDIEKERTLSDYIQDILVYLLGFVSLIAVIYIIYAGTRILLGAGDEDTLKNSKSTILYVALGMVLIWLAYPIVRFIIDVLNVGSTS